MNVSELLSKVSTNINESAATVADRVVSSLTEKEVSARVDAFMTVLVKLEESRKAAKKIKPDSEMFAIQEDGTPAEKPTLTFSKAKMEERKKNTDEQKRLEEALNKALEGDFTKCKELGGKASKE